MERRFELRLQELLAEAEVDPRTFEGTLARLQEFLAPFSAHFCRPEQVEHALEVVSGLLSNLPRKNTESIAYSHDHDRRCLQHFIGQSQWEHAPLLQELAQQVGHTLGEAHGVLVCDPSGFTKKGTESVGVQRQWCGRVGKVENCQVAVYLGYVSGQGHALVNTRLYLPKSWSMDRKRCKKCGVPRAIKYQTRHKLCLEMLDEVGHLLPHAWLTGDDEMGRNSLFRAELRARGEGYLLAVPSNTLVRDLQLKPPDYDGRGAPPKTKFQSVAKWCAALPANAWTKWEVRDGEKGPLQVELVKCRVQAKLQQRAGPEETLVVIRCLDETGATKHDYYLSAAPLETSLAEFARVAKAEHRIEECIQRGKSETGLADYEVRTWSGWYHHQTLSLLAAWFVLQQTERGKKIDTCVDVPANAGRDRGGVAIARRSWSHAHCTHSDTPPATKPTGPLLPIQETKPLSTIDF